MIRYTIEWKAYPMNRSGIKEARTGLIEIVSKARLNLPEIREQVMIRVRQNDASLSSTPIFIRTFEDQKVAA